MSTEFELHAGGTKIFDGRANFAGASRVGRSDHSSAGRAKLRSGHTGTRQSDD
jgi:hypothetical protein